jgi:predicted DNA-binding transcriptional regulator YafY
MLSIPAPLAELGVDHELKAALLKLSAALPSTRRPDEERARQRIHLDSRGWHETREPVPHLRTLHQALWQDRRLHLSYSLPFEAEAEWLVEPYGLVAKVDLWYLVCAREGHIRVYRVSHVLDARLSDETFERPGGFDLAAFWQAWCADVENNRPRYPVTVRVAPSMLSALPLHLGESVRAQVAREGMPDGEGWTTVRVAFETFYDARARILGLGGAAEVLEPRALRNSVSDFAAQVVDRYSSSRQQ